MELKIGYISLRELSLWFGLKPTTLPNYSKKLREKKLKILESFCDFHYEGVKLYIDKVYIPVYSKAYQIIEDKFDETWGNIVDPKTHQISWQKAAKVDSCSRVGKHIWHSTKTVSSQIAETSAIAYTSQVKRERYGRTYKNEMGTCGFCELVYLDQDGASPLPQEKLDIMRQCRSEAYQNINECIIKLDEAYHMGEITAEEKQSELAEINTDAAYERYEELLCEKLGFIPRKLMQLFPAAWSDRERVEETIG